MEQTTNTFSKGLQMDTHPIVLGNDTLSDALNATFVTMNGNEVVLQNDMGNAKIDNAYLPPGYQPVGMKEYGGIIYVAAYNPITNKSQIGSFPSPERKISVENPDLGNNINFNSMFNPTYSEDGIHFIKDDVVLTPLTSDTSLHAGDKFTVYSDYIWKNKNDITNFDNVVNANVTSYFIDSYPEKTTINDLPDMCFINPDISTSPKNKKYTLSLGILNSQNEFVDITKSLVRWGNNTNERPIQLENETNELYNERLKVYREAIKPIEFNNNESDLIKFNTGYFIAKDFVDPLGDYTENDKKLIAERLKMAANSYVYKLVGPLYLKTELNHIQNFNYTIQGSLNPNYKEDSKDENEKYKAEILITATITYNCPDGIDKISEIGDDNYFDYFVGVPEENDFPGFHLFKKTKNNYEREYTNSNKTDEYYTSNDNEIPKTEYNPETNLYTVTISKKYKINETSDNKYEYYLCVPSHTFKDENSEDTESITYYIKGISTKGEIDFSKLGSGTLEVNEWRFYNTMPTENSPGNTLLTYKFDSYPRIGHKFSDLEIKLKYLPFLVGLLIDLEDVSELKQDERAAATWFLETYPNNGIIITPSTIELIEKVNTLWINIDRGVKIDGNGIALPNFFLGDIVIEKIKTHVENGGNLYLTKFASHLIKVLKRVDDNVKFEYKNTYDNVGLYSSSYPYPYLIGDSIIFNNMEKKYTNKDESYYVFIEDNSGGLLNVRYYILDEYLSDCVTYKLGDENFDDYCVLGKMMYIGRITSSRPSIIEFYPKTITDNDKIILDLKGTILIDGSIYLWTGSLNVKKSNLYTLTSNCINYLNSKRNKISNVQQFSTEFGISKGNINIGWKGLNPRTLYDVEITYKEKDEKDQYVKDSNLDKIYYINNKWILTTELFNDCYNSSSLDFVDDYSQFNNLGENLPDGLKYLIDKLLIVGIDINENIEYNSTTKSDYKDFKKLISKNPLSSGSVIESSVTNSYNFDFNLNNPSINIINEILYPEYINVDMINNHNPSGTISFAETSINKDSLSQYITEYKSSDSLFSDIILFKGGIPKQETFTFGKNNKIFSIESNIIQKIVSEFSRKDITILNYFNSFDSIFLETNSALVPKAPWCSLGARCPEDCGGDSPVIEMHKVQYSNNIITPDDLDNAARKELFLKIGCGHGDRINEYNFSEYFNSISEFFNVGHENSQFIVGITNWHEAHLEINSSNTLDIYYDDHRDLGAYIFIAWIRTLGGWVPFYFSTDPNIGGSKTIKDVIINSNYYQLNLKYFHTNFKPLKQLKQQLYIVDFTKKNYHYVNSYDFDYPVSYEIKVKIADTDLIIGNKSNLQFKIPKETIISNNIIYIKYKSNERFDNMITQSILSSSLSQLYSYDVDLDTMEDSEYNILLPEVKYIEINSKLFKNFKESNNILNVSENGDVKIFSFPKENINISSTYPDTIHTLYASHAKKDKEGLSVIGLRFNIGAKKFVTNG